MANDLLDLALVEAVVPANIPIVGQSRSASMPVPARQRLDREILLGIVGVGLLVASASVAAGARRDDR